MASLNIDLFPTTCSGKSIHLSEATYLALQHIGRYVTEYRGELSIKVRS